MLWVIWPLMFLCLVEVLECDTVRLSKRLVSSSKILTLLAQPFSSPILARVFLVGGGSQARVNFKVLIRLESCSCHTQGKADRRMHVSAFQIQHPTTNGFIFNLHSPQGSRLTAEAE